MNNEQNLLIAEFMGMKFNKARKCYHTPSFGVDVNGCKIEDLGFSNSWDWIMAVVQKMNRTDYWAEFEISALATFLVSGDMRDVYNEIIEFITEYNQRGTNAN